MSAKRFTLVFIVIFFATTIGNFLIHGMLLRPDYDKSLSLLRTEQGDAHLPFLLLAFFFFSLAFVWMYAQGVGDKPWLGQGIRYGIAIWLVASVMRYLVDFAVAPWPGMTIAKEIGYELPLLLILGVLVAALSRE